MTKTARVFRLFLRGAVTAGTAVLLYSCATVEESAGVVATVAGSPIPADSLPAGVRAPAFRLHAGYYELLFSADGRLRLTEQGGGAGVMDVYRDTARTLRAVSSGSRAKDIILLYETEKDGDAWSEIARIDPANKKVRWRIRFGAVNLSTGRIQGPFLYGATLGVVGKVDLDRGKIVWRRDDLWERYKANDFDEILIYRDTVAFLGTIYTMRKKTMTGEKKTFKYHKHTGKELF